MRNPPYVVVPEKRNSDVMLNLGQLADNNQNKVDARNADLLNAARVIPINRRLGVRQELFNLSTAVKNFQSTKVFRITHCLQGSAPGALLTLDIGGGGRVDLYPGDYFEGLIEGFDIVRHANSVTSGNARLVFDLQPDAKFGNLNQRPNTAGLIARYSGTQTYNVTTNTPSLATDGVAIAQDQSLRVMALIGPMATRILTGTVRYWFYDPTVAAWMKSAVEYDLAITQWNAVGSFSAGSAYIVLPDEIIGVPEGRFFPEFRSVTTDAGAGNISAYVSVYGN